MTNWKTIESAPRDGRRFIALDSKHGRVEMRRYYVGETLYNETWAIDPCGIIEPPEPHLWDAPPSETE